MEAQQGTTPLAPPGGGPSDAEISRALDRLTKARIRVRDVVSRTPRPTRSRLEAVERARRAVEEAAAALRARPDDPEVQKTHALAEIAEIMALRQEGFATSVDYDRAVRPDLDDPALEARRRVVEAELATAQAEWEQLKSAIVGDDATTLDLTADPPVIETR